MKTIFVDTIYCFVSNKGKIFEEMYALLEMYPNRKILLTGANKEQFMQWKLDTMPYEVFTLMHNPEKTNPLYFEQALQYFQLSKDEVIYFEHSSGAVQSAELVGILSYHYNNEEADLIALKTFLDINA